MPNKAILVACPTCRAAIGVHCMKQGGKRSPEWWSHRARVLLATEPGAIDEGRRMAIEEMEAFIRAREAHAFECCGSTFADLGAVERHRASGHDSPVILGLTPTSSGWSSR